LQCDTRLAHSLLSGIERDEEALRSSGLTVEEATYNLDRIDKEYQSLNDEVQSKIGQNNWQRQEVQGLWDRVGRWQKSLEDYARAHQLESNVARAVSDRGRYTAREAKRVQSSHSRSPMTHEQARRVLEELWQRVHDPAISVRGQSMSLQAGDIEREFLI